MTGAFWFLMAASVAWTITVLAGHARATNARLDKVATWAGCPCRASGVDCDVAEHRRLTGYDVHRWTT